MDPPNDQHVYDWPTETEGPRAVQPYMGHVLQNAIPVEAASQSPIYTTSHLSCEAKCLPTRQGSGLFTHPPSSTAGGLPQQHSIVSNQAYQYSTYSHPPARSMQVMSGHGQGYYQQLQSYYQTVPVEPSQPSQPAYDDMPYQLVDYSQFRHNHYTSSARSTLVAVTPGHTPISMRVRRAPYTNPHSLQETSGSKNRKRAIRSAYESPKPSLASPVPAKEEHTVHEEANGLQKGLLGARQAVPAPESSSIELHLPSTPALPLPAPSEVPNLQPLVWAEEQPKPVPHHAEEDTSSSSQTPPISATPTQVASQPQPGTVFINSNLLPESASTRNLDEDYDEYREFFPDDTDQHRQLRIALHDVMTSEWKRRNELEPTSRDLLQFSVKVTKDASVSFKCLLHHGPKPCDQSWNRAERALAHLRKAIDLRPFVCEGDGGESACNCSVRFFSEDTLQQHKKNVNTVKCEYCESAVTPRNKQRHLKANCAKSPFRA